MHTVLTPDVTLSRGTALLCKTSQRPPLWSSHLAGAVLPPLWSSYPPGAHEWNGRRPQNRAKKKGPRPKNRSTQMRKVKLSGCPVRALFWLAAPVSLSSGAVLPAWSCRVPAPVSFSSGAVLLARSFRVPFCFPGLLVVVLGSWSVYSPCLGSRFLLCFLSLPGGGRNFLKCKSAPTL